MIVKIKIKSKDGEIFTMLFGDSYKTWDVQFSEYRQTFKPFEILEVETSKSKWKAWGGLKWCNETEFQNELNTEDCQWNEKNPKPRIYSEMIFTKNLMIEKRIQFYEKFNH
jgi:hypothetical protein